MTWQPISSAPKDGRSWIVVWGDVSSDKGSGYGPAVVVAKPDEYGWHSSPLGHFSVRALYWTPLPDTMPLPPPPGGRDA